MEFVVGALVYVYASVTHGMLLGELAKRSRWVSRWLSPQLAPRLGDAMALALALAAARAVAS